MDEKEHGLAIALGILLLLACAAIGGLGGFAVGQNYGKESERKRLASYGLGHYEFNERTGETDFNYGPKGIGGRLTQPADVMP